MTATPRGFVASWQKLRDVHREVARIDASFTDLGIAPPILRALDDMGFEEPSPIQLQAVPLLLSGKDVIGQAETGTGKTAAFAIPALQRCRPDGRKPQALVIVPTRELALQVAEEIARIAAHTELRETAIYGGQPFDRQVRALRAGVDVVVGTPGRLLDHLRRGTLHLSGVRTLVLDEGDEMLDMGFIDDIEAILQALPEARLTAIFSATVPPQIRRLAQRYLRDPAHVRIAPGGLVGPAIAQHYYEIRGVQRADALFRILDAEDVGRAIIFCRTKRGVDNLAALLQAHGYLCEAIHGDLPQARRLHALSRFRDGLSPLLVATDVAARGLDVEGVTHVINFDIAASPDDHVHRIGRTGRAGRAGIALTLVQPREVRLLRQIADATRTRIPRRPLPTPADVALAARDSFRRQMADALAGDLSDFVDLARELAEEYSAVDVAAAAIKLAMDGTRPGDGRPAGGSRAGATARRARAPANGKR